MEYCTQQWIILEMLTPLHNFKTIFKLAKPIKLISFENYSKGNYLRHLLYCTVTNPHYLTLEWYRTKVRNYWKWSRLNSVTITLHAPHYFTCTHSTPDSTKPVTQNFPTILLVMTTVFYRWLSATFFSMMCPLENQYKWTLLTSTDLLWVKNKTENIPR